VTILFLLALALTGFVMKLVALLMSWRDRQPNWAFVLSPVVSPSTLRRARPSDRVASLAGRAGLLVVASALFYAAYWALVRGFNLRGVVLSYLAIPIMQILGETGVSLLSLLWSPSGIVLPPLHYQPVLARGIGDFWGNRWNLWFSDWFRFAIFDRWRDRPGLALWTTFAVSGVMHEWVLNLMLYFVTGRALFGTMMLYFLLQAAGVQAEHRFLKGHPRAKIAAAWPVVFVPSPLVINEGLLRALCLWPG
jgi:hypothetical protein